MSQDVISHFYASLNLPLEGRIIELAKIIEQSALNKDLQAIYPILLNNIFGNGNALQKGWGLRSINAYEDPKEFSLITRFLHPQGPLFNLCYKLLADSQYTYNLPLHSLPVELQMSLERGRCHQFYADLIYLDNQTMLPSLALNAFDYYIFNFALHLLHDNMYKSYNDSANTAYFNLVLDYLVHFLPIDPNTVVLPQISHFAGKLPTVSPLQTANSPFYSSSLLVKPEHSDLNNQHSPVTQTESRNEVWRTESVLQIFIDVWMSVDGSRNNNVAMYNTSFSMTRTSAERVRIIRSLVKQVHRFSSCEVGVGISGISGTSGTSGVGTLRRRARQMVCARGYRAVRSLVEAWPLDASFKVVLELWLSLIQPWRYIGEERQDDETKNKDLPEVGFTHFIAENFPTYTCIFQIVLPRFIRLDLTAPKNAILLFRLGKVFSQTNLLRILKELEHGIINENQDYNMNQNSMYNNNSYDSFSSNRWAAVAKQSIADLNLSPNVVYEPLWSENKKNMHLDFYKRIVMAVLQAEKNYLDCKNNTGMQNQGFWSSFFSNIFSEPSYEQELLQDLQNVPQHLKASLKFFSKIFDINEEHASDINMSPDISLADNTSDHVPEHSSYMNSSDLTYSITKKLRSKPSHIDYMGDPELKPITSRENTILVRILYQLSSRLNAMYQDEFSRLWESPGFTGVLAREILQPPRTIQTYVNDVSNHSTIVSQTLPPRLSFRSFGTHSFIIWVALGYVLCKMLGHSGFFFVFIVISMWLLILLVKAFGVYVGFINRHY